MAVNVECIYAADIMNNLANSDYLRDVAFVAGVDGEM